MNTISAYLQYLPSSQEPLSADVYLIHGDQYEYVFDVGNNEEARDCISGIQKEKIVILSHYHEDHVGNIDKLKYHDLYVGNVTRDTIQKGTVIESELTIQDGVTITIRHCPSPHVPGSLIVTINGEYTLFADLYFTKPDYDRQAAKEMLDILKEINTKYFVVSHQEKDNVFEKEAFLRELCAYFFDTERNSVEKDG